jgi:hypothetical protein
MVPNSSTHTGVIIGLDIQGTEPLRPQPFLALLQQNLLLFRSSLLLKPPLDHVLRVIEPGSENLDQYFLGCLQLYDPGLAIIPGAARKTSY